MFTFDHPSHRSTNYNSIDYVDDLTCQLTSQLNMGGNSLSFDTQDNLYFNALGAGTTSTSAVYRLDSGSNVPYIWHDFNSGTAGGDFVIFGNYMYIAWKFNEDVLLKVTIDDDINYVSHEVLGPLKFNTFGLASEQGVLYGITEGEIYKINLSTSPPSFETILQNDYTHGAWYGSAGFSEAIAFSSSAHISQLDADENDLLGSRHRRQAYNILEWVRSHRSLRSVARSAPAHRGRHWYPNNTARSFTPPRYQHPHL